MKIIINGSTHWVHPELTLNQLTRMINFMYPGKVLKAIVKKKND